MIQFLKKLWAQHYLRSKGYCTKHLTFKEGIVYDGGVCEWCPQCDAEKDARDFTKLNEAKAILKS